MAKQSQEGASLFAIFTVRAAWWKVKFVNECNSCRTKRYLRGEQHMKKQPAYTLFLGQCTGVLILTFYNSRAGKTSDKLVLPRKAHEHASRGKKGSCRGSVVCQICGPQRSCGANGCNHRTDSDVRARCSVQSAACSRRTGHRCGR